MKLKILPITFFSIILIFLLLTVFMGDTILFYTSSIDDKLYGNDNKYIDSTLSEPELSNPSNLKDSYKFQDTSNKWTLKVSDFFLIVLKIFGIIVFPLFLFWYFVSKDKGIIQFFDELFGKKE